jgi:uncharacterized protein (TIGR03067 family)
MSISLICPTCGKRLRVRDELAGRRVKCPGCAQGLTAAGLAAAPARRPQGSGRARAPQPTAHWPWVAGGAGVVLAAGLVVLFILLNRSGASSEEPEPTPDLVVRPVKPAAQGGNPTAKGKEQGPGPKKQPLAFAFVRWVPTGLPEGIRSLAVAADGRLVLASGWKEQLRLYDVESGQERRPFAGHAGAVIALAFSPDGGRALSGGEDKTVRLWDIQTGKQLRLLDGHAGRVAHVAFSPDGRRALSGGGSLRYWDLDGGKELRRLTGHAGQVGAVAFSPDGRRALSGCDDPFASGDNAVRVWDLGRGEELRRLQGHTARVRCVAFSPDGRRALSGGDDQAVRLWDVATGGELRRLEVHPGSVGCVAFLPDGRHALSASGALIQTTRRPGQLTVTNTPKPSLAVLWDLDTGQPVQRFEESADAWFFTFALSADGRSLLFVYPNQSLGVWRLQGELTPLPPPKSGGDEPEPKQVAAAKEEVPAKPPEGPAPGPQAKGLQGTWRMVGLEAQGASIDVPTEKVVEITADKLTIRDGDKSGVSFAYQLDPAGDPPGIVLRPLDGPDKGKEVQGLYGLAGDRLRLLLMPSGRPRPRALETKPGGNLVVLVLRRQGAKDTPAVQADKGGGPKKAAPDPAALRDRLAKGGRYWTSLTRAEAFPGMVKTEGSRLWIWPETDELITVKRSAPQLTLRWSVRPGQPPLGASDLAAARLDFFVRTPGRFLGFGGKIEGWRSGETGGTLQITPGPKIAELSGAGDFTIFLQARGKAVANILKVKIKIVD